ncbi:MAG: CHAT domain-containing protein, partial [Verrucomicrobiota bacterium]
MAEELEAIQNSPDFDLLPSDGEGFYILEFGENLMEAWTDHYGERGRAEFSGRMLLMMALGTGQFQTDFLGALMIYPYLLNEKYRDKERFYRVVRLLSRHSGLATDENLTNDEELTVLFIGVRGYLGLGMFEHALEWARESARFVEQQQIEEPAALAFTFLSLAELEWSHGHAEAARKAFSRIPQSALEQSASFLDLPERFQSLRASIAGEPDSDDSQIPFIRDPDAKLREQYLSNLALGKDRARSRSAVLVRELKNGRLSTGQAAELREKLNRHAEETGLLIPETHRGRPLSDSLRLDLAALDLERPFSETEDLDFLYETDYARMKQLAQVWFDELYGSFYAQFGSEVAFFKNVHDLWQAMEILEYSLAAQVTRENMIRLGEAYSSDPEISFGFQVDLAPIFVETLSQSAAYHGKEGAYRKATADLRQLNKVASQRYSREWQRGGSDLGESISRLQEPLADALESWSLVNEEASAEIESSIAEEAFFTAQLAQLGDVALAIQAGLRRSAAHSPEVSDLLGSYERVRRDLAHHAALNEGAEFASGYLDAVREAAIQAETRLATAAEELRDVLPFLESYSSISPVSKESVGEVLGPKEALVFVFPGKSSTALFAVHQNGILFERSGLSERDLAGKIARLRLGLDPTLIDWKGPSPFDQDLAYEIYAELLEPLGKALDGKNHLIYVAEGAVSGLPFQVLLTNPPSPGLPLFDVPWLSLQYATTVSPSVAGFVAGRSIPGIPGEGQRLGLVGFADPDFGQTGRKGETRSTANLEFRNFFRGGEIDLDHLSNSLEPLPESREELETVVQLIGGDTDSVFVGRDASETQVRQLDAQDELARYRIVYFATHALVTGELDGVTEPGLVLTLPDRIEERDDGFLAASEIARLRLNADWV